jgi:hypothetical protein
LAQRDGGHDLSLVQQHIQACLDPEHVGPKGPTQDFRLAPPRKWWAKAIHYALRDLSINEAFLDFVRSTNQAATLPVIRDIPCRGSQIPAGAPVVTVLAQAESRSDVEQALGISRTDGLLHAIGRALGSG